MTDGARSTPHLPQGRHDLPLDIGIVIPQDRLHADHSIENLFVVVPLSEVVTVAAALTTGENLLGFGPKGGKLRRSTETARASGGTKIASMTKKRGGVSMKVP